ncbi:thymidylate kinase [Rhodospirillaceae bacterium LM-1]|nr:thymidylate kinase [Rhodospirillaceae bacterium LM-1]
MGKFITLEGGEGGGKSTQAKRLADFLEGKGNRVLLTREPGGSQGAEDIRKLLVSGDPGRWDAMTEALLHTAARRDHLQRTVLPAIESGSWVISDRFVDSTVAYQGYGHDLGAEHILEMHRIANAGFMPDLTLILDLPVEEGLGRANSRGGGEDRYERMKLDFHHRLRQGFLAIAAGQPDRCKIVNAALNIDAVTAQIQAIVCQKFGLA